MDINLYLQRINYKRPPVNDLEKLTALHRHHVLNVPFENLDVYFGSIFDLKLENIFDKVVIRQRGGFCYELNLLFHWLLLNIGYDAKIIAAKIIDDEGKQGPPLDHMCLAVEMDKTYLLDVGYGDLMIEPIEIKSGIHYDGRNYFKISQCEGCHYILSMSEDGQVFMDRYIFNTENVKASDFSDICHEKQINPESYFVKNRLCTKPTIEGRITLFNENFIEKRNGIKKVIPIIQEEDLSWVLKEKFGMLL